MQLYALFFSLIFLHMYVKNRFSVVLASNLLREDLTHARITILLFNVLSLIIIIMAKNLLSAYRCFFLTDIVIIIIMAKNLLSAYRCFFLADTGPCPSACGGPAQSFWRCGSHEEQA